MEACEDAASYYLAFELCTGGTLLEAIEDRFAADWEECVYAAWLIKDSIMRKDFGRTFKFIYPSPRVFVALKKENESWNMSSGYFTSTPMLVLGGFTVRCGCLDFFLDGTAVRFIGSPLPTEACTHSFHQILKTVEYMHLKHVCHRSLGTDAIVLHGKEGFVVNESGGEPGDWSKDQQLHL